VLCAVSSTVCSILKRSSIVVRHLVSSGSSLVGEHHLCGGVNRHLLDVPAIGGLPRLLEQDYERKRKTKDGILRDAPMPTHTIQRVAPPDVGWLTCNLFNYHFLFSGSARVVRCDGDCWLTAGSWRRPKVEFGKSPECPTELSPAPRRRQSKGDDCGSLVTSLAI
jgi:hypothetical protein